MTIPKLTEVQRIESFENTRLGIFDEEIKFSKRGLAKFCLKEIDNAFELAASTDIKDVEEQFSDEED